MITNIFLDLCSVAVTAKKVQFATEALQGPGRLSDKKSAELKKQSELEKKNEEPYVSLCYDC